MAQNINLYDASLRITHDPLGAPAFAAAIGGALLAVAAGTALTQWRAGRLDAPAREVATALQQQQASIQQLARAVDTLKPAAPLVAEVQQAQAALTQRQAALQMLRAGALGEQQGHAAALQAFARQSIEGLWLTGLVLDRRDVALRGRSMSPELIPAYVGRLNQEPALQGRSFRALDIARPLEAPSVDPKAPAAPAGEHTDAAPRFAAFVEFSLSGTGGARVARVGDKR